MKFMLWSSLKFIGSLQFMNSNLDNLVNNISTKELKYTSKEIGNIEPMSRKGDIYDIYNEYMDSFEKVLQRN